VSVHHEAVQLRPRILCARDTFIHIFSSDFLAASLGVFA
jgi:hypothetical protein